MSAEQFAISKIVTESSLLAKFYAQGISLADFLTFEEEFAWIEERISTQRPVNARIFHERFPDFPLLPSADSIADLTSELRDERTFVELTSLLQRAAADLEPGNAIERAEAMRAELQELSRQHSVHNDVLLEHYHYHLKEMRKEIEIVRNGAPSSALQTRIPDLDRNWGGLLPGQLILILGRTGEGKSYKALKFALSAKLQGASVLLFTPEMSPHEVRCRLHTLASALPEIQQACGLRHSFRNRDLFHRRASFSLAAYERFCRYFKEELPGRIRLITQTRRGEQMSVAYIQDRIEALAPQLVIIDPIYLLKPVQTYKDNPYMEIGRTTEAIEQLCERYNIPFVITNQSHRQGSQSDAPDKNKSFGSDIPAQLADYVLGVKHISEAHVMHCRCTKARFCDTFRYQMRFNANTGTLYVQEDQQPREEE